ncbi:unnamed protein product [Lymnaea stagnalis]|uniref:Uncharacterized protein n=1 Tax=Lymnaea stagnalis TaxID=6523 RepID=A0AAV2HZS9_LYMST
MPDIHNICLMVAILSVLVSSVVIWSTFVRREPDHVTRKEREIKQMLARLQQTQQQTTEVTHNSSKQQEIFHMIISQFPWLADKNTLGNYFTDELFTGTERYHKRYTHSSLSILPYFQDFDGHFENCVLGTGTLQNQAVSPAMTFENRHKWDRSEEAVFKFKHKFKIHYGEAAFGMCDSLPATPGSNVNGEGRGKSGSQPCGHVLIMQDPLRLAIAHYGACLLDPSGGSLCQMALDPDIHIEGWIKHRGNVVFRNLVFNSDICSMRIPKHKPENESDTSRLFHKAKYSPGHVTLQEVCESHHRDLLDSLDPELLKHLLDYILHHLNSWFSLVGTYEDFINSLTILHHVFRFPLHSCEFLSQFSTSESGYIKHKLNSEDALTEVFFSQNKGNAAARPPSLLSLLKSKDTELSLLKALSHVENKLAPNLQDIPQALNDVDNSTLTDHKKTDYDIVDLLEEEEVTHDVKEDGSDRINDEDIVDVLEKLARETQSHYFEDLSFNDTVDPEDDDSSAGDEDEVDSRSEQIRSEYIIPYDSRQLTSNRAWDGLYDRLSNDQQVLKAVELDLQIYAAVKKLYQVQKLLFFNSIKN